MNIYEITFKKDKDYEEESEVVIASSIEGATAVVKTSRPSRLGFLPIIIGAKLLHEDVLSEE